MDSIANKSITVESFPIQRRTLQEHFYNYGVPGRALQSDVINDIKLTLPTAFHVNPDGSNIRVYLENSDDSLSTNCEPPLILGKNLSH